MSNNKTRILLVEDDYNLGFVMQDNLKMQGYKVVLCPDGKEGMKVFSQKEFDLCILDVMLPKKDGFSLAEDIRKTNTEVPIIFVTAKGMEEDKITGFKTGADDYITKPFSMDEFLLRVEAILRRSGGAIKNKEVFQIGSFTFNHTNYELTRKGKTTSITKKEGDLLKLLAENPGKVMERQLICNAVWGEDDYFVGRSLDVFITRLRKHLKADKTVNIANSHGVGFKLECE